MPKSPWLRPSAPRISSENSEIKKVWPSDDQNAMIMPNSKKRHSTRINLVVFTEDKGVAGDIVMREITACGRQDWQDFIKNLDERKLKEFGVKNEFEWHFNSGDAPWQNGCSESLIPSVKKAIKCAIGEQVLSFSELLTVMYEAANLVNERPIGKTNMDIDDGSYLCPNDLLLGRSTSKIQTRPFDTKANAIKRL